MVSKRRATEVSAARGRLKGALQDIVSTTENDSSSVSESTPNSRGRPKRSRKDNSTPLPLNHAYIMKLFDRSVDLAKYRENSALYPICRAWMINQPRSHIRNLFDNKDVESVERKPLPGLLEDITLGKKVDITEMPAALKVEQQRIPALTDLQKTSKKENIDLIQDSTRPKFSREQLLTELKRRTGQVRNNWIETSRLYEDVKYGPSMRILESIYGR